ncbi:MAG: hypothetical protein BGO31_11850 [Bacteroidetes bacterium 43-16]|nr:MAG: hypothetical protein BGO31_11850 [Bacteroidetes bacterium 43-16]
MLLSCKPLMLKMYHIKKPAVESKVSILKTALRYGLDTTDMYTVAAKDFLGTFSARPLPDILVFDSAGNYIEYRNADTYCNGVLFDFIPSLHPEGIYPKAGTTTLQEEMKKLRDIDGHELSTALEKADFYLLIYWTVWMGKLNKDQVKVWEQLARQNKKSNIKVLKVNLDIQQSWAPETRANLVQSMRKPR